MSKQSINLLIPKENDSPLLHRLKIILPVTSLISLGFFILLFIISFIFVNMYTLQFNDLKKKVENIEGKITSQKAIEGAYSLTATRVETIAQILSTIKNFSPVLSEIIGLPLEGVTINEVSFNKQENLFFSVTAVSVDALDNFISILLAKENSHIFSNIKADGISRDKKANYRVNISLKFDPSYLK